jgi:maltose alpha-D-glucosyltransferase/alpha-amylase
VLEQLVPNQGGAWQHTIDELRRFFDAAAARLHEGGSIDGASRPLLALLDRSTHPAVAESAGPSLQQAGLLGERTAEMHLALARADSDPALVPEPFVDADLRQLSRRIKDLAHDALGELQANAASLPNGLSERAYWLLSQRSRILRRGDELEALELRAGKLRCHGSYGLTHLLWTKNDFVIRDFEGDPARPASERRAKQSPLVDVASMLRSLARVSFAGHAAFTSVRPDLADRLEPWAQIWQMEMWSAFLQAYRNTGGGAAIVPDDAGEFASLLELFLLETTLRELSDALRRARDGAPVALQGLVDLFRTA